MCDLVLVPPGPAMVEPALFFISLTLTDGSQFSGRYSLYKIDALVHLAWGQSGQTWAVRNQEQQCLR